MTDQEKYKVGTLWKHRLYGKVMILDIIRAGEVWIYCYNASNVYETELWQLKPYAEPRMIKVACFIHVYQCGTTYHRDNLSQMPSGCSCGGSCGKIHITGEIEEGATVELVIPQKG